MTYDFKSIEARWQKAWEDEQAFRADDASPKPKYYALDMFPYPSGSGLHIGHMASYSPTDAVARYKRAKGFNVLHPMGYDAFGLPAEQYAIQTGVHPAKTTENAIANFRRQLKSFGFSFDWSREVSTADPDFYKWTQFIFKILFGRGLAYQKEAPVNWCPELRTVLANEEVIDGKSERGGHPVIRVPMKQWMLRITAYAERLLEGLDRVDWPERTKEAQRNWIGKSEGAEVRFEIEGLAGRAFEVFTTRPDTLFGVTFMVVSPEHPLLASLVKADRRAAIDAYVAQASRKSEVDRKAATEKTGEFTGSFARHPITGAPLPIWTADYVLMDYGTGAVMGVPGHDERDFEFATKFNLPIVRVLASEAPLPFAGDGALVNSDFLNGLAKADAIQRVIGELEARGLGKRRVEFRLRDWLFSRQRYWGEPFPIVHMESTGARALPSEYLPLRLPEVADYQPSEKGEAPLARNREWVRYRDLVTGETGARDTDTMPGWAGSSWYFLRFADPRNGNEFASQDKQKKWMPVDLYVGGPEHSVLHLLYARFWQKALFDAGLATCDEPFQKLAHQGIVLAADGERMSKSRGNVVNVDEVRDRYGADALRCFILFMGPMDHDKPWNESGIGGVQRFLERVWRLIVDPDGNPAYDAADLPENLQKTLHKTIKKVGDDLEAMSFNTAISAMMILVNESYRVGSRSRKFLAPLAQLLAPFAPHLAEEAWARLGGRGLAALAPWPQFDSNLTVDDVVTIGVQVNGKSRGAIEIAVDASEAAAIEAARATPQVEKALQGKEPSKVIYRPGRILNLIVS